MSVSSRLNEDMRLTFWTAAYFVGTTIHCSWPAIACAGGGERTGLGAFLGCGLLVQLSAHELGTDCL